MFPSTLLYREFSVDLIFILLRLFFCFSLILVLLALLFNAETKPKLQVVGLFRFSALRLTQMIGSEISPSLATRAGALMNRFMGRQSNSKTRDLFYQWEQKLNSISKRKKSYQQNKMKCSNGESSLKSAVLPLTASFEI